MFTAQGEHPLGGAQPIERVHLQELVDDLDAGRADGRGALAAPGRVPHEERDLAGRIVAQVALAAAGLDGVRLDQLTAVGEELHLRCGGAGVQGGADVLPRHRIQRLADLDMQVGMDTDGAPAGRLEPRGRQRPQPGGLDRGEHPGRLRPGQRPAGSLPRHLGAPRLSSLLQALQAVTGEVAALPKRVADIGHRPLDLRLVTGLPGASRVDEGSVVLGQLGVGAVDLRIVEVRLVDAGLEVIGDQPRRAAAEEGKRLHVAARPFGLVHRDDRAHEHVPGAGQHHDERPQGAAPAGRRVGPHPQLAVVDLGLLTGSGRVRVEYPYLIGLDLLGQVGRHIPAQGRDRHRQIVLVTQPLVDRGRTHPGL